MSKWLIILIFSFFLSVNCGTCTYNGGAATATLEADDLEADSEMFQNDDFRNRFANRRFRNQQRGNRQTFVNARPKFNQVNPQVNPQPQNFGRAKLGDRGFAQNQFARTQNPGYRGSQQFGRQIGQNLNKWNSNIQKNQAAWTHGKQTAQQLMDSRFGKSPNTFKKFNYQSKSGNIQIEAISADAKMLCLDTLHFCYINCQDLGPRCKVSDAEIFSIRVDVADHLKLCYNPRVAAGEPPGDGCYSRPCNCKIYETQFVKKISQSAYNLALSNVQAQCHSWCDTGIKPAGVWDRKDYQKKTKKGFKGFVGSVGKFLLGGIKAIGKIIGKIGKAIGKFFRRW